LKTVADKTSVRRDLAARRGTTERRIVVQSYSVNANSARLTQIFRDVAGRLD
jgi:hypothetical protein